MQILRPLSASKLKPRRLEPLKSGLHAQALAAGAQVPCLMSNKGYADVKDEFARRGLPPHGRNADRRSFGFDPRATSAHWRGALVPPCRDESRNCCPIAAPSRLPRRSGRSAHVRDNLARTTGH